MFGLGIHGIHGSVYANSSPCLYTVNYSFADSFHFLFFLFAQLAQNESYLLTSAEIVADTYSYACIFLSTDEFGDIGEAVVSSSTSVLSESQGSERNVEVVRDDDDVFYRYLELVHPITYSFAAEVHVCGWLEQKEFPALE